MTCGMKHIFTLEQIPTSPAMSQVTYLASKIEENTGKNGMKRLAV